MTQYQYTQCIALFVDRRVSINDIAKKLSDFQVVESNPVAKDWLHCGPSITIQFPAVSEGFVVIDTIDQTWPDGDDDSNPALELSHAWETNQFGLHSRPGSLARTREQLELLDEKSDSFEETVSCIRIRLAYRIEASQPDDLLSQDIDVQSEVSFLTSVAIALASLEGVIAFFNPSGEVLVDRATFEDNVRVCLDNDVPLIFLWTNVRLFRIDDSWAMMDTVGNGQFDLPDLEACFDFEQHESVRVSDFLWTVSLLINENPEMEHAEAIEDDEGLLWHLRPFDESLCDPQRFILRLIPQDGIEVPPQLLDSNPSKKE